MSLTRTRTPSTAALVQLHDYFKLNYEQKNRFLLLLLFVVIKQYLTFKRAPKKSMPLIIIQKKNLKIVKTKFVKCIQFH